MIRPAIVDEDGLRLVRSLGQIYVLDVYMGLIDICIVGHYPDMDMKITTDSPRLDIPQVNNPPVTYIQQQVHVFPRGMLPRVKDARLT